jgi:Na+/H+ antiporter NhaC
VLACRYDPFRGFLRTIDTYAVNAFADDGHIKIILFNWFLCGVTGLIQRGGGGQDLANIIVKKAKTRRLTMLVCFICGVAIFFDSVHSASVHSISVRPIYTHNEHVICAPVLSHCWQLHSVLVRLHAPFPLCCTCTGASVTDDQSCAFAVQRMPTR